MLRRILLKKILIVFISLFIFAGCTYFEEPKDNILTYDISSLLIHKDSDIELLGVDNQYIYINELDTLTNPFLFSTRSLIMLNHEGELVRKIKPAKDKRIVDFLEYNEHVYYMYLLDNNDSYFIELCKVVDEKEEILETYVIDDPYAYPKFWMNNNKCYYKINNNVYHLDTLNVILNETDNYFLSKQDNDGEKLYYKVSNNESVYTVYCLDGLNKESTGFSDSFGNFIVSDDLIIYKNLTNKYLYLYNINTDKKEVLIEDDIFDFILLDNHILCATTENEIIYFDLNESIIIKTIDKKTYSQLEGIYNWIKKDNLNNIYFQNDNKIIKIENVFY